MSIPPRMALRNLLRTPAHLRPLLIQQPHHPHPSPVSKSHYHSYEPTDQQPLPYRPAESAILSAALTTHVPRHGFTPEALRLGAKDAGYLDISANLFPAGAFELVKYHLVTQRLGLKDRVQFPSPPNNTTTTAPGAGGPGNAGPGVGAKVRTLILARLRANLDTGVIPHWQQALGLMSLAENIPTSLRELGRLSDEIWFLAGDQAVDSSWYTKRASLMGVFAATEGFQSQVMKGAAGWSPQEEQEALREMEEFLDRRLEEVRVVGGVVGGSMQWAGFQARGLVNLVRSKGVRI